MAEVYVLTFPNGKQYVGRTKKTADARFQSHCSEARCGSSMLVHKALRKYGSTSIRLSVLVQGISWEETAKAEVKWIAQLGTMAPKGYNLTAGGEGTVGLPIPEKTRRAVATANSRRRGTVLRTEHRQKIAAAIQDCWQDAKYREEHTKYNRKRTKARSDAMIKRWQDPKYQRTMALHNVAKSQSQKGKTLSEETRRKMSESQKRRFACKNLS